MISSSSSSSKRRVPKMKHTTTLLWLFSLSKTTTRCMRAKARLLFYSSVRLVVAMTRVSRLRVETCSSFVVVLRRRRPSSSSSDVLVFSPLFFFRSFFCVCCVCVFCVKTEEEEQEEVEVRTRRSFTVLFLFFVSKNFISFYFRPGFLDTGTYLYSSDKTLPRTAESFVIERWG